MKKMKITHSFSCPRIVLITWILAGLPLGVLAFAAVLWGSTSVNQPFANWGQDKADIRGQTQPSYVPLEEEDAYGTAKREPDPQKRARKLFEFIQKYPKSALIQQSDYEETKPIEDEYDAYYSAMQESDVQKRGVTLIEFLQKFPKSTLVTVINQEYLRMLEESSQGKKYELLESLAENWLKIHPNDRQTYAFIAEATMNLQKYQRCGECLEEIYEMQPSPSLAREIHDVYQKAGDPQKQVEWGNKLIQMPEFADDYMLRFSYVAQFSKNKDLQKASDYAQLTLEAAALTKLQDAKMGEQLLKVHHACHHIIASNLLEKGNFSDAIAAFKEAIKDERYADGYYRIGQCLEKQKEIEQAANYYAMAELVGGEEASKAKARLEVLYRALHNDTLVGIDKVYKKAKELLAEAESKS